MMYMRRTSLGISTALRFSSFKKRFPFPSTLVVSTFSTNGNRTNLTPSTPGLYSLGQLYRPDDFIPFAQASLALSEKIKATLSNKAINDVPTANQALQLLDGISNAICSAIDVAELCRHMHSDGEFRNRAEEVFEELSNYIHELNQDKTIYQCLKQIVDNDTIFHALNDEQKMFTIDLLREIEANGIHLLGPVKEKMLQLQGSVNSLETSFSQAANSDYQLFAFGPIENSSLQASLRQYLDKHINPDVYKSARIPDKYLICSTNKRIAEPVLVSIHDDTVREQIWTISKKEPNANEANLGNLIRERQSLAKILGYKSYAHKTLANRVLKSPEQVNQVLGMIHGAVKEQAEIEAKELKQFKIDLKKSQQNSLFTKFLSSNETANNINNTFLRPWDIPYLTWMHKTINPSVLPKNSHRYLRETAAAQIQPYLSLKNCIEGLKLICYELFGLEFIQSETFSEDELWTALGDSEKSSMSSDRSINAKFLEKQGIMKFVVRRAADGIRAQSEDIGIMYLDLFYRPNKFLGSAHFTARCGCNNTLDHVKDVMSQYGKHYSNEASNSTQSRVHKSHYGNQLPIIALLLNVTKSSTDEKGPLFALQEVETLFHEWGHAMHSMLSRTEFQHLSGTRGALDFAEVPSHLFEYFAKDPRVLKLWAKHYKTNEVLDENIAINAMLTQDSFPAIDVEGQLLMCAIDMYLFGDQIKDVSDMSGKEVFDYVIPEVLNIQDKFTSFDQFPFEKKTRYTSEEVAKYLRMGLLSHTHFVNYGASYYSYLLAKMYAAQIWARRFENNPLSRESGSYLWNNMLIYGASKDPQEVLTDMAKGDLDPSYYLKSILK